MPSTKKKKFGWWKLLYFLAVLLFGYLVYVRRDEIFTIVASWDKFSIKFLFLAFVFQVLIFVSQSYAYKYVYQLFGLRVNLWRMFWVLLRSNFLGVIAPSGGFLVSIGVIMEDGFRQGFSKGKLLLSNVVYWVVYYLIFIFFLLIGLFYMTIKNQINDLILIPAIILLILAILFLVVVVNMLESYEKFKNFSLKVANFINSINKKLGRDKAFKQKSIKKYAFEIYDGYCFVIKNWFSLNKLVISVLLMIFFNVAILSSLVAALGGNWYSFGVLLSCYAVAGLLMVISITPSGLGVVELSMTTVLTSFLLPLEQAVLVVIFYRLFQFWCPVIAGFIVFRTDKKN